jgi:hypothetical protein
LIDRSVVEGVAERFYMGWGHQRCGFGLKRRWAKKSIDVGLLCKSVEAFFTERGLKVKTEESSGKCSVFLLFERGRSPAWGLATKRLVVRISAGQNGFAVEFRGVDYARSVLFRSLAQLFVGGLWFRRDSKLERLLSELENEFWPYMDEAVSQL